MARPPLPLGTWGEISAAKSGRGWRARARYRDYDGVTRPIEASGATSSEAKRRLREKLAERATPPGAGLSADSRIQALADQCFADMRQAGKPTERTVKQYEATWKREFKESVGALRVREARPALLNAVLGRIQDARPSTAPVALSLLRQVMSTAVNYDLLENNPAAELKVKAAAPKDVRALTLDELKRLRANIAEWQAGPRRPDHLTDLLDVMLGTGIRISDLCALRWENVDLDARKLVVDSHIVRGDDGGWTVAPSTKSHKDYREMTLPLFTVATLARRRESAVNGYVFPDSKGTSHARPASVMEQWRKARGEEFAELGTHVLRKTVATLVAAEAGSEQAAGQLGHSSAQITRRHYIQPVTEVADLTHLLETLGAA